QADERSAGLIVGFTVLLAVAVAAGLGFLVLRYPNRPHRAGDGRAVSLVVGKGMTPAAIARALAERDVLDHPSWFRIYATERGDAGKVRAGRYRFTPSMTPKQILDALIAGAPEEEVA